MNTLISLTLLLILIGTGCSDQSITDEKHCHDFPKKSDNYKIAHTNKFCLKVANAGIVTTQYQNG